MKRLVALIICAVSLGAAAQIETWSLSFNGPSSYSIAQLAEGNYVLQVSGTFCGGSCSGGHTTDAAYRLQNETAWGGRSFTVNEYCPQGWEGAGNCQFLRPTPDIFSPEHIYFYHIFHSGGQFTVYGLADECCWGDNLGGLDFALIQIEGGCTDMMACNYDADATSDDGSCIPSGCMDTQACNFNVEAACDDGSCDYSCCPGPGCCSQGLFWDWELGQCFPINPADINLDGCVQLNDLLDLLSAYGDCGAEESPWQCGDPLEYQGYDYETVQIGEQCWFAENLRAENYRNGDVILANLSDSEWSTTISGAVAVYGEDSGCASWSPVISDCNPEESLSAYGRLYNWYAVDDARHLCPSNWHVPTDGEWIEMEISLGMNVSTANSEGWRGTNEATQLKASWGWFDGGNGTNSSGFSGMPGGNRSISGEFQSAGRGGDWWTSSATSTFSWDRDLNFDQDGVGRQKNYRRHGFSIRCIEDTE